MYLFTIHEKGIYIYNIQPSSIHVYVNSDEREREG